MIVVVNEEQPPFNMHIRWSCAHELNGINFIVQNGQIWYCSQIDCYDNVNAPFRKSFSKHSCIG